MTLTGADEGTRRCPAALPTAWLSPRRSPGSFGLLPPFGDVTDRWFSGLSRPVPGVGR